MSTNETVSIFLFVVGSLLGIIGFISALLLNDIRKQMKQNASYITRLARAGWALALRQADVEQHLSDPDPLVRNSRYKPLKIKDADPPVI